MKYCKYCGTQVMSKDATFCPNCGKHIEEDNNPIQINIGNNDNINTTVGKTKNKWVAFFLCLFLGGIGAHKFYEGKIVMGILYLLFCWTYIPVAISIVDLIIILGKPREYNV